MFWSLFVFFLALCPCLVCSFLPVVGISLVFCHFLCFSLYFFPSVVLGTSRYLD
jgi:hypothetical protein